MKYFVEFLAYIRIFLSPMLFFGIVAGLVYWYFDSSSGVILAIAALIVGVVCGLLLSNYARKRGGAVKFISRLNATPELDKKGD
jgi:hypothetical protein